MKSLIIQLLPKLRRFAYSLTGNVADADDLVQNTVERLLAKESNQYQPSTALVFTICKNIWIDEVRKRQVRRSDEFVEKDHSDSSGGNSQEQALEVDELMSALNKLPSNSRIILSMVCIAGMTYSEAAEELEIPVGTVMSRVARARISLAEIMQHQDESCLEGSHAIH